MKKKISLTVVVPVYNEEKRIDLLFRALEGFKVPKGLEIKEVRLVDDGSTDKTLEKIKVFKKKNKNNYKVKVVSYKENMGRGFALRMGLERVKTDYAMYLDGDGDISIKNLTRCFKKMQEGVDLVVGSKKMPGAVCSGRIKPLRWIMGYGHTAMACMVLGVFVWDFQGGFKVFSKELLLRLLPKMSVDQWGFDLEVIYWAKKLGFEVKEVPLVWGRVIKGTKVKVLRDVYRALRDMLKIRREGIIWSVSNKMDKLDVDGDWGMKLSLAK